MGRTRPRDLVVLLLACAAHLVGAVTARAQERVDPDPDPELILHLVDAAGQPVAGASVGTVLELSDAGTEPGAPPQANWRIAPEVPGAATSDDRGEVRVSRDSLFGRTRPARGSINVLAVHEQRALGALVKVVGTEGTAEHPKEIRLDPTRHVRGTVTSEELALLGRPLERAAVVVMRGRVRPIQITATGGALDLWLPPGAYQLYVSGRGAGGATAGPVTLGLEILPRPPGSPPERPLTLDGLDLPAGRFTDLMGQPAPELVSVAEWRHPDRAADAGDDGPPVTLASLRGKVVVLYFWSYTAPTSIVPMPALFDLHRDLADRGLAVIAMHDDSSKSLRDVDARTGRLRRRHWEGRSPTFPVALDSGARDGPAATYGAFAVPFAVVIDRAGKVVASFDDPTDPALRATIEKSLASP
jgi:peroxiredoxin